MAGSPAESASQKRRPTQVINIPHDARVCRISGLIVHNALALRAEAAIPMTCGSGGSAADAAMVRRRHVTWLHISLGSETA